jgi:hypothetical protein
VNEHYGIEMLSPGHFQEELRRIAGGRTGPAIENPLDAAMKKISDNPAFSQSRLLARLLIGLVRGQGEFRRAELTAFDLPTLSMIVSLLDAHRSGRVAGDAWLRALDLADAVQLGTA